jgi:hypothetical protein
LTELLLHVNFFDAQEHQGIAIISTRYFLLRVLLSLSEDVLRFQRSLLAGAVVLLGFGSFAFGQAHKAESQTPKQAKPRPGYSLQVSNKDIIGVSLKAEKTPLPKLAAELSSKLKIPVLVGPAAQNHEVTANFKDLTLEPALHSLAPQVFVDYEINPAPGIQSRPIGIYLNGYQDPEPAITALVPASSESILIEGHTEDEPPPVDAEVPTKVLYEQQALSVTAKRQPLSVLLYRIAYELHIPFELKWETTELVDINIDKLPLEEAMPRLSPHVRLFVRANLQKFERRPFRMVLVRPPDIGSQLTPE